MWTVTENNGYRTETAEMHVLKSIVEVTLWDQSMSEDFRMALQIDNIIERISYYGHEWW